MSALTDVIVVGAGSSGLSAAKELTRLGLSFTLVDGSHRIGGRAYSEEIAPGVWFDLGCSYLHQGDNNPFVAIADELGLVLGKDKGDIFDIDNKGLYKNGVPLNPGERKDYAAYYSECFAAINAAADRGEDVAVADLVDLESEFALTFSHDLAEACACDIDEISSVDVAAFDAGPDIPVLDGYGNLIAAWGSDLPVSLNNRVRRIYWSDRLPSVTSRT